MLIYKMLTAIGSFVMLDIPSDVIAIPNKTLITLFRHLSKLENRIHKAYGRLSETEIRVRDTKNIVAYMMKERDIKLY